jgi:carnitine-CoA ligase
MTDSRTARRPSPPAKNSCRYVLRVTPVEPEETGHLLVKGTPGLSLFAEYLNQPTATANSFDEGG